MMTAAEPSSQQISRPAYITAGSEGGDLTLGRCLGVNYSENKKFMLATAAPQSPYMEPDNLWADRSCWWVVIPELWRIGEYGEGEGRCQDPEMGV